MDTVNSSAANTHVFISYVRNSKRLVQRLCDDLTKRGVKVWLDRRDIDPGVYWKQAIRRAIQSGAFFIACFSSQYNKRLKTYMNEELALAVGELRQRLGSEQAWFIPVLLSKCEIPDIDIGASMTCIMGRDNVYENGNTYSLTMRLRECVFRSYSSRNKGG